MPALLPFSMRISITHARKSMRHFAFIDITSAYDDVFLDVLCDTLYNINLPCKLIQMVCVLLTKRTLYFYINGILRETRAMYKGLGQDTFLSPLLYIPQREDNKPWRSHYQICRWRHDILDRIWWIYIAAEEPRNSAWHTCLLNGASVYTSDIRHQCWPYIKRPNGAICF